jgi:catechol 2,3-dioxygenase-like lactoylglutathione lyase family enzyme
MGIPGLRGADHVGISVPDLERAVAFFVDVIGAEPFYALGPYRDDETDSNEVSFGVHPRAVVNGMRLLRLANLNIELFEWEAPDQDRSAPRLSDVGACELCLYVDDMDAAIAHLREHGVEVLGDKLDLADAEAGPEATFQYFRTPWGAVMELISYPHGRAYEADYAPRALWNPGKARIVE